MPTIELSTEEAELLEHTCEVALSQLRLEIARTESPEFREMLRHRRELLERLRDAVARVLPPHHDSPDTPH